MSNAGASLATCYGPVSTHMMAKAENIRLLILDVDGVLSDGLIYMGNNGEELKAFNVRDGYGIRYSVNLDIEGIAPVSIWIGLRPRYSQKVQALAQFLAAFPVNLLFPLVVMVLRGAGLDLGLVRERLVVGRGVD